MVVGVRRHMPRRRSGHTTTVTIGAERFCLTANQRDDGSLGEVFIHWGKHGTSAAGLVSTYAIALSLGLQHQVPLADLIRPGLDQFFVPNGHTDDPEIPRVRSAVDYIARRLAIDWLPYPDAPHSASTPSPNASIAPVPGSRPTSPPARAACAPGAYRCRTQTRPRTAHPTRRRARCARRSALLSKARCTVHRPGRLSTTSAPAARRSSPRGAHGRSR